MDDDTYQVVVHHRGIRKTCMDEGVNPSNPLLPILQTEDLLLDHFKSDLKFFFSRYDVTKIELVRVVK